MTTTSSALAANDLGALLAQHPLGWWMAGTVAFALLGSAALTGLRSLRQHVGAPLGRVFPPQARWVLVAAMAASACTLVLAGSGLRFRLGQFAEMAQVGQYVGVDISEFRRIVNQVQKGEKEARQAKKEMVEANLRLVVSLDSIENLRGICKAGVKFKIEIEGERKPALEGIATFLYYFK